MTSGRAGRGQAQHTPTPAMLELVARRFRALAEPARLVVLHSLENAESSVSELVERTGIAQGTISKHLQVLYAAGFVRRRRDGQFVLYGLADADVLHLCELMCGRLEVEVDEARGLLSGG